jgi:hypothetical protein
MVLTLASYSAADAAYVTDSRDPDVLNYVVCLATKAHDSSELDAAFVACKGLADKIGPIAEDINIDVMECGFRSGDASPDMDCEWMHGGTNPGAPKGNRNAYKHGGRSAATMALARYLRQLARQIPADKRFRIRPHGKTGHCQASVFSRPKR